MPCFTPAIMPDATTHYKYPHTQRPRVFLRKKLRTCHEGNLAYKVSAAIVNRAESIFSPQATKAFLKAVAQSKANCFPECSGGWHIPLTASVASIVPRAAKKRAIQPIHSHVTQQNQRMQIAISHNETRSHGIAQLPVNKKDLLHQYYEKVFENLQQANCRVIAKAYIKLVEPRKQVRYPYNGRKNVGDKIQQFNSEETKPPWWPIGVTHREPDHLPKAERIALLVHILCELRISHGINARKLKLAGQPVRGQITPVDRLQLLDELYLVREEEEHFLDAVTDGSTCAFISYANLPDSISDCVTRPVESNNDETFIGEKADFVLPKQAMPTLTQQVQTMLDTTTYSSCLMNALDQQPRSAGSPFSSSRDLKQEYSSAQGGILPITPVTSAFTPPSHSLATEFFVSVPQGPQEGC